MNDTENESRLARWSRRKRQARDADGTAPEDQPAQEFKQSEEGPADSDLSEEQLLEKYQLPNPETLQAGDDFSAFMRKGVPDLLRRKALRVLWKSNPALANLDGLIDYGEDFTDAAVVPETIATVYQVGKGIVRDVLAQDESPAADLAAERPAEPDDEQDAERDEPAENPVEEQAPHDNVMAEDALPPETTDTGKPRPRRMKFSNTG